MRYLVCKTSVPHPEKSQFVLQFERDPHRLHLFPSIGEMAAALREGASPSLPPQEPRYFKNDVPGDVVWDPAAVQVAECERLTSSELADFARLLRQ